MLHRANLSVSLDEHETVAVFALMEELRDDWFDGAEDSLADKSWGSCGLRPDECLPYAPRLRAAGVQLVSPGLKQVLPPRSCPRLPLAPSAGLPLPRPVPHRRAGEIPRPRRHETERSCRDGSRFRTPPPAPPRPGEGSRMNPLRARAPSGQHGQYREVARSGLSRFTPFGRSRTIIVIRDARRQSSDPCEGAQP